jgi:hypothetical protein
MEPAAALRTAPQPRRGAACIGITGTVGGFPQRVLVSREGNGTAVHLEAFGEVA